VFVVSWYDSDSGQVRVVDGAGATQAWAVPGRTTTSAAMLSDGSLHVAWFDGADVVVATGAVGSMVQSAALPGRAGTSRVHLAADPITDELVLAVGSDGGVEVTTGRGAAWGAAELVSADEPLELALSVGADGSVWLAHDDGTAWSGTLRVSRRGGCAWTTEDVLLPGDELQTWPGYDLVVDPAGLPWLAFVATSDDQVMVSHDDGSGWSSMLLVDISSPEIVTHASRAQRRGGSACSRGCGTRTATRCSGATRAGSWRR
jgi:hypothetical protein